MASPHKSGDAVVAGVHELISEWLATFSPAGGAVSTHNARLVVGHLLLLSRQKSCADVIAGTDTETVRRLAAATFVLIVQEHLHHGRDSILGFDVDTVSSFLADVVKAASITIEALVSEVISVDLEGSASSLVGHRDFATIFGQESGVRRRHHRLRRILSLAPIAEGSTAAAASAEAAAVVPAGGMLESPSRTELRSQLATRYTAAAVVISSLFTSYNVLAAQGAINIGDDILDLTGMLAVFLFSFVVFAGLFPTNESLRTSGHFVLKVAANVNFVGICYMVVTKWRALPPHNSVLSELVHATALVGFVSVAGLFAWLISSGLNSWRRMFILIAFDGALYVTTVSVLHALGPPPPGVFMCYPPGSLSLPVAALRAFFMMVVLPSLFSEARRLKIARLTGLTHVRVRLEHLQGLGGLLRGAEGKEQSSSSSSGGTAASATGTTSSIQYFTPTSSLGPPDL